MNRLETLKRALQTARMHVFAFSDGFSGQIPARGAEEAFAQAQSDVKCLVSMIEEEQQKSA